MRYLSGGAAVLLAIALFTGCSTVQPSGRGRVGLLDRIISSEGTPSSRPAQAHKRAKSGEEVPDRSPSIVAAELKEKGLDLRWPVDSVQVTSRFGDRGQRVHEGIDLRARTGTPVYAAEAGVVLYAGLLKGYGRLAIIRHRKEIATVYAHNSRLLVRVGQRVRRGDKIALSGNSGQSRGPHVHFEVRNGVDAIDPWLALPDPKTQLKTARGLARSR